MLRGFSREVLAIASWAAAAAAAYYFYPVVLPYLTPYIHKDIIAQAAAAAIVFFATLIVVSLFTVAVRRHSRQQDRRARSDARFRVRRRARVSARGRRFRDLQLAGFGQAAAGMGENRQDPPDPDRDRATRSWPCCPRTRRRRSTPGSSREAPSAGERRAASTNQRPAERQADGAAARAAPATAQKKADAAPRRSLGQAEARRDDQRRCPLARRAAAEACPDARGDDGHCESTPASTSTTTGCARNAACSASSAIPTPRRSPRSGCTPSSIADRRRRASSPSTATGFTPNADSGLVGDHFSSAATIERLPGRAAVGHVRYSTTGETVLRNVQPLFAELDAGGLAVAHNGNLTNGLTFRRELIRGGAICQSTSDTEVVLLLAARSRRPKIVDRFIEALQQIKGAYALVALTNKKLIGARDPLGIRPLVLGELDGCPILASETCALDIIGAKFIRDVENGEVVVIDADGVEELRTVSPQPRGLASSNTSISPGRIRSFMAVRSTSAQGDGRGARPRGAGRRRRRRAGARLRRAGGDRLCARAAACRSNSASSATITSAGPSSSRPRRSVRLACA